MFLERLHAQRQMARVTPSQLPSSKTERITSNGECALEQRAASVLRRGVEQPWAQLCFHCNNLLLLCSIDDLYGAHTHPNKFNRLLIPNPGLRNTVSNI
jgi:hypothetical protein